VLLLPVTGFARVCPVTGFALVLITGFALVLVTGFALVLTTGFGLALIVGLCLVPMTTGFLIGRGSMALAAFLACPRLIPWLTIRSLSTQKSRPRLFALFTVALNCPEFLKPDAGSAKYFEVDTGWPVLTALTDERLADVVGLVLDLGAVTLLGFCVVALGAWAFGALAAWTLGALALGPAEVGFASFGLPFLAMAGTAATAMDSATAAAVRKRSYFMWSPPDPRRADEPAPHGS
jgi:hypothetical protein